MADCRNALSDNLESAGFRCPQCGGRLEEQAAERGHLRLACTRGHVFSADELFAIFAGVLERGEAFPWAATPQILTEYADLARRLVRLARQRGDSDAAAELAQRAREAEMWLWRLRRDRLGT